MRAILILCFLVLAGCVSPKPETKAVPYPWPAIQTNGVPVVIYGAKP